MIADNVVQRPDTRDIVYLKHECPWSLRFLVFLTEAGLLSQFQVVRYVPDAPGADAIRALLEAVTGKAPAYPTVERPDGTFVSDSGALIEAYAAAHGIDRDRLVALDLYERGVLVAQVRMFQELRALRG
jgi:hypothetical protein